MRSTQSGLRRFTPSGLAALLLLFACSSIAVVVAAYSQSASTEVGAESNGIAITGPSSIPAPSHSTISSASPPSRRQ